MGNKTMRQELVQLGGGAHALAIQILGNGAEAADDVQDAFITALSRPASYDRRKGPLKPWFLRVVRNRSIDLLRKRRPVESTDALLHPGIEPEQVLQNQQRDESLHKALVELSSEQRQIIVLRDYLDLSYAEIADVLAVAPGTVMSRLHRARLALKKNLESHDE